MQRLLLAAVAVAVPLTLISACKDGDDDELGEIGQLYLDFLDELDGSTRFFCECEVEAGYYDNFDECWANYGGPTYPPILAACYAEVIDAYPEARESIECEHERYVAYNACLEEAGCEGDTFPCEEEVWGAPEPCPEIPYAAQAAITEACLGYTLPPPFVCDDGSEIPSYWECDGEPDCEDGSDEVGCPIPPGAFQCDDGELIPEEWVCDSEPDCADGSDEADCP